MTDELGDAFDEMSDSDEATNALFRRAQSLDDTKRFAEGLFHEGALYQSPVVQGETDLVRDVWERTEKLAGGDVVGKAVEGYELVHDGNPADVWEDIEPKDQSVWLDVSTDRVGTTAVADVQIGMEMEAGLAPGSPLAPAGRAVYDEWQELQRANVNGDPDHGIPFKDPEIPDTDAVVGDDVSDQVVAMSAVDDLAVAESPTDPGDATTDPGTAYDTSSYETVGYETSSYETSSYETSSYETAASDLASDVAGAFGSTSDDTGSSFTDF
jgi:hypothetical protein